MTNHDKDLLVQYGQGLPEDRRRRFHHMYMARRKDVTPAVLFALFLGGIGAHHFYLGHTLIVLPSRFSSGLSFQHPFL